MSFIFWEKANLCANVGGFDSQMTSHSLRRCKALTEELLAQPLNVYFKDPVNPKNDGLLDYFEKISKPMDYTTIQNKLKKGEYQTENEWYTDVCLIYNNAMEYHPKDSIFHIIAEYCLKSFKKMAPGLEYTELQDWYDEVCHLMQKFTKEIGESPVPQGMDPLLLSILEGAKDMLPLAPSMIPDYADKLNELMVKSKRNRSDIVQILKVLQPSLDLQSDHLKINFALLSQTSINALCLYVRAH